MITKSNQNRIFFLLWIFVITVGLLWLTDHSTRPGIETLTTSNWPENSAIQSKNATILLLFLHPHCPCSLATMTQLNRIANQSHTGQSVETKSVFFCPNEFHNDTERRQWAEGSLFRQAKSHGDVIIDVDGVEAKRFGVTTSGHVFLYKNKQLVFSGGITSGRGHEGDSPAADALLAHLRGESPISKFAVFGCEIQPTRVIK